MMSVGYCPECERPLSEPEPPRCPQCKFPLDNEAPFYCKEIRRHGDRDYYIDCPACQSELRVAPISVNDTETFRVYPSPALESEGWVDEYAHLAIQAKFRYKDRVRVSPDVVQGAPDRNRLAWILRVIEYGNREPRYEIGLSDLTTDGVKLLVNENQIEWASEQSRNTRPLDWSQPSSKNGAALACHHTG